MTTVLIFLLACIFSFRCGCKYTLNKMNEQINEHGERLLKSLDSLQTRIQSCGDAAIQKNYERIKKEMTDLQEEK